MRSKEGEGHPVALFALETPPTCGPAPLYWQDHELCEDYADTLAAMVVKVDPAFPAEGTAKRLRELAEIVECSGQGTIGEVLLWWRLHGKEIRTSDKRAGLVRLACKRQRLQEQAAAATV